MARTVINLDEELCSQAAAILGTRTKVSTVNAALKDLVSRHKRKEFLDWLSAGNLPDLADPEIMESAWRR